MAKRWATLWAEDSGSTEATMLKRSALLSTPRSQNWLSMTPNQALGVAVQKSGNLKNLVGAGG